MMKRSLIIFAAVLALTTFGTVSSAHALIDPVSLTVILGVTMIVAVTGGEIFYHKKKEAAGIKDKDTGREVQTGARAVAGG